MLLTEALQGSTWCHVGNGGPETFDCEVSDVVKGETGVGWEWNSVFSVPNHTGSPLRFRGLIPLVLPYILGVMFSPISLFSLNCSPLLSANKPTLSEEDGEKALVSSFFFFSLVIRVSWGQDPGGGSRTEGKLEPKSPRTLKGC